MKSASSKSRFWGMWVIIGEPGGAVVVNNTNISGNFL
jgi:hypothetical protein